MTPRQRIELRMSEARSAMRQLLELDDPTAEQRAELEGLVSRMAGYESQLRAAILADPNPAPESAPTPTPEGRELATLLRSVQVDDYLTEAITGRPVQGAPAELRRELLPEADVAYTYVPLDLLLPLEQRVDAVTNPAGIAVAQQPIAARVFNTGAADYLGVDMRTVPPGTTTFPRITAGTIADVRSEGVELDGTAATITSESVAPARLTASYTISGESTHRLVGLEGALRADLRMVMMDKIDDLVINGQSVVANTSPAITGLLDSLTDPTDPTGQATALTYINAYTESVDGKYADSSEGVRLLVNPACYKHAHGLQFETSGDLLRDRLMRDRFRASANMPAVASKFAQSIVYASSAPSQARGLIAAVWRGMMLIEDPYTKAKAGQRIITAVEYVNFVAADLSAYRQVAFQVQA